MSQAEFERRITFLRNQLHTLMMARKGQANIKRVKVVEHTVPEHRVSAHTRVIYSRKAA